MTSFIIDIIGAEEAERLGKNSIKWERKTRRVSVLRQGETMKGKMDTMKKTLVQKRKEEVMGKEQQPRKATFLFVICYNCRRKRHTLKSCILASRAVSKKIDRKAESGDKGKKSVKIIDNDEFTKVVNTQSTLSPTPVPAPKTPIPEPRIVELKLVWNKLVKAKMKAIVEKAEQDGWKVKGPLTGPS